jgi:putative glutamine amidotransferase
MAVRPQIGITTSFEDGTQKLAYQYVRAIEAAGGLPIIVPVLTEPQAVTQFTALLDGLLMVGGPAIEDGLIGQLPPDLDHTDPARQHADALIFNALHEQPILGVCYGMQFINAQRGGKIYADVQAQQAGATVHSASRGGHLHPVELVKDSWLAGLFAESTLTVNTYHIQAVAELGDGLRVAAYSADGVIEAIESTDRRLVGVQWHPERMLDQMLPIFRDFVARCAATSNRYPTSRA